MKPEQVIRIPRKSRQRAASLIMVMMILVIVSLLGIGGAQIALMSERGARNDRDLQVAWQAAESALLDAEFDMTDTTSSRKAVFNGKNSSKFVSDCSTAGTADGLYDFRGCPKPAWLSLNFSSTTATVFGAISGRTFASGNLGVQPAQAPLYIIELVDDPSNKDKTNPAFVYRVTAMGFGPRTDIQAVSQMIFRTF